MVWKRKEKPLTPEEAIVQAKKELAPFWFNTEPLLAAIRTETGASALPLGSDFAGRPWVFFFIDPGEYSGEGAIQIAREWHRRYQPHKLGTIIFLRPNAISAAATADIIRKYQLSFPVAVDHDSLFATSFKVKAWPAITLQNGAQEVFNEQGLKWSEEIEQKIQSTLRVSDPGLALPLAFSLTHPVKEASRIDLGTQTEVPRGVHVIGQWTQGEDFIRTQDSHASLELGVSAPCLSIVARSGLETQTSKIILEFPDGGLNTELLPEHVSLDESGRAVFRLQQLGLHHFLKNIPASKRSVRLSFPDAETIPVLIYGIRWGIRGDQ